MILLKSSDWNEFNSSHLSTSTFTSPVKLVKKPFLEFPISNADDALFTLVLF
jgi:hypothetical protein